ncbi:MAG: DEAD/DEAH box helicase, partial [Sciscionella sp.]
TGWGKSAVYFVATALLRERGAGPTVIVSPLIALMRNQIEAATRAGIAAVTINSANQQDWPRIERQLAERTVDVLLISPERLNNPDFRDTVLPKLAATIGLLVVDEAHCISDWGHDFRPDYRRLAGLLAELPTEVAVMACTATANDRVIADVSDQLGLASSAALVLRGELAREGLALRVVRLPDAATRLGWLAQHLADLPGSGIIYTLTVSAAVEVAEFLADQGFAVASYTGRTEGAEREQAEADLLGNSVKALVATSALGMGFDKPDLGFVIHLGAPDSPVSYYQHIGRAGRAISHGEVILLPGKEDREIWAYFAGLAFPAEEPVRALLEVLRDAGRPVSTAALETQVSLARSRLEMVLKVLDADGVVRRVRGGWQHTGASWTYDEPRYTRIAAARRAEQQAMLDYQDTTGCRMRFLLRQLDDPHAADCGHCDNCTATPASIEVSSEFSERADARLHRPGVPIGVRKMWPSGMPSLDIQLRGKIADTDRTTQGRALGRLTDIGWGTALRALFAAPAGEPSGDDTTVPERMITAAVAVLAAWDWSRRPVGIVVVASHSRPRLVTDLAGRLGSIGKLPLLGSVDAIHRPPRRPNSAQRLAGVFEALRLPADTAAAMSAVQGPVLLVDDYTDSGWTLAVAARLLRRAGAPEVLPFTLASTG